MQLLSSPIWASENVSNNGKCTCSHFFSLNFHGRWSQSDGGVKYQTASAFLMSQRKLRRIERQTSAHTEDKMTARSAAKNLKDEPISEGIMEKHEVKCGGWKRRMTKLQLLTPRKAESIKNKRKHLTWGRCKDLHEIFMMKVGSGWLEL